MGIQKALVSARTRVYHRDAMHLQQRKLKAFQQHLVFKWANITPLHPSFYFSASKNVFWASLSFPTLSVRYNRWSRNRELYSAPHLILKKKKKKKKFQLNDLVTWFLL